jgi:hypothetical protein
MAVYHMPLKKKTVLPGRLRARAGNTQSLVGRPCLDGGKMLHMHYDQFGAADAHSGIGARIQFLRLGDLPMRADRELTVLLVIAPFAL